MLESKYNNNRRYHLVLIKTIIIIGIILCDIRFLNSKKDYNSKVLSFDFCKDFPLINNTFIFPMMERYKKIAFYERDNISSFYFKRNNDNSNKNFTIILKNIEYEFSLKYNITEVKYQFCFYNVDKLIAPSNLTLLYNLHVFCNIENKNNRINVISLSNIYENKYFYCIEYFNMDEKLNFGIKIPMRIHLETFKIDFFSDNIFDYNDLRRKNESKFDPLVIDKEYTLNLSLNNNSNYKSINETLTLKKSYIINPNYSSKSNLNIYNDKWTFINIYNHYFCLCKGLYCYPRNFNSEFKICKYKFYSSIIDENRNTYNKTDYLFADFFESNLSFDDTYPIFEEMIKTNNNVHYVTKNMNIYRKYCNFDSKCLIIIRDVRIDGDFMEKYLELILKLKAAISGSEFVSINQNEHIFYNIEYITSINVGHGIKYFKSFLYKWYSHYEKFNKLILPPSKKIISVALNYGWKVENIIKMCLPKWDKYDNLKLYDKDINHKSIFIFFTKRTLKDEKYISFEYINNILKILNNNTLEEELINNNISLYYCLHRSLSKFRFKIMKSNKKLVYINNNEISSAIIKSSLLVTDFSSIIFDFAYQGKPIIIYLPDSEDPEIKDIYDKDYYELINDIKDGKVYLENRLNTTDQVINKIIYYIHNDFKLESNLEKYYDSFELKCGKNITKSFIRYIENIK